MLYKRLIFILILFSILSGFAQTKGKGKKETWATAGFDFYIGGGIYLADKATANYYNGAPENEVNLNLLFDNTYRFNEISLLVKNNYAYVDSLWLGDYPKNMSYKVGTIFGLGVKYKLNKDWGITLNYSTVKLTASDVFLIMFDLPPGNERNNYAMEYLNAKEERSFFDLSVSRLFHLNPVLKPFVEMGLQFNYLKVKSFQAVIEDRPFDMLSTVSSNYIPGQTTPPNYRNWAAPGYGLSLTGGLKIVFNESFSLDPAINFSISSFGHSDNLYGFFTGFTFNYNLMIRLVMSDLYFNKK